MYYTCKEVAERFRVQERTVWSWIRSGKLPAVRVGKQYRITEEDINVLKRATPAETGAAQKKGDVPNDCSANRP